MGHNWDPKRYEESSSAQAGWANEILSKLSINGDEHVLDIGCGDGRITAKIASLVPRGYVVGLDSSSDMIEHAKQHFSKTSYKNLDFVLGDAKNLDFYEEFDLIVSFAALHWILDQDSVLIGIKNALKPDGKAFFQFGGLGNAAGIIDAAKDVISTSRWKGYFVDFAFPYGFFGPEEYRLWIEEAGLKAIRVELIPKDMVQQSTDALSSWIETTWLPYTERVPKGDRSEFIKEIVDAYLQAHPVDELGRVHVKMARLEVELCRM